MDTSSSIPSAPPPPPTPAVASNEDKTVAILSYITIIGFIVAIVMHGNKKTKLGTFHLRQALGIVITGVCLGFIGIIPILGWLVLIVGMIVLFIVWLMGLIAAASGEMKPAPILGPYFQKWFGTAFE
jgi:uncharacterized membrane protein